MKKHIWRPRSIKKHFLPCLNSQQAEQLGREDQQRLHRNKKLVLMVDLDQTLIHTTEQHCQRMSNKVLFSHSDHSEATAALDYNFSHR